MTNIITVRKLKKTSFSTLYWKLLIDKKISKETYTEILSIIILFINSENETINNLGYRMLLIYTFKNKDYKPLYEVSINLGLYPISKSINNIITEKNVFTELNDIYTIDTFTINGIIRTIQQKILFENIKENTLKNRVIVAPTSYGKTELILEIVGNMKKEENLCVITPTKALLSQTRKRIKKVYKNKKIITNPELYAGEKANMIAVLTQERFHRLIRQNDDLKFDYLIIDEAHNLLDSSDISSNRSLLLASAILISKSKNPNMSSTFLTPNINNTDNLTLKYWEENIVSNRITEMVKSEIYYFHDLKNEKTMIYDQYLNEFNEVEYNKEYEETKIIIENSDKKNIIYANKPRIVQQVAKDLAMNLVEINNSEIKRVVQELSKFIHSDYDLIDCIKKGVVYHHGSMRENVRNYVEYIYKNIKGIKYIVTNSTLLEGVNIPGSRMFIVEIKKGRKNLNSINFENLVGRICRFNEIFTNGQLKNLLPVIHIFKGKYSSDNMNIKTFANKAIWVEKKRKDQVENPLLKYNTNSNPETDKYADEFIENISDQNIIKEYKGKKAETEIGKTLFRNNVTTINVFDKEHDINNTLKSIEPIKDIEILFKVMNEIFFFNFKSDLKNENLLRLQNRSAREFYMLLLRWRYNGKSYKQCLNNMVNYWNNINNITDGLVYVGKNWGDVERGGYLKHWTYLKDKSKKELINIAILRLKEEYEFVDNQIFKYIDVLYNVGKIKEGFYHKLKYGTTDQKEILLLNYGFSYELIKMLDKYDSLLSVNFETKTVNIDKEIFEYLEIEGEDSLLIKELELKI